MTTLIERMEVVSGDITQFSVDAIVNASNETLSDGSGVNGAIHRAAGPALSAACARLGGCETGHAKITPGFLLPAKYIIHTVGPLWHGGSYREGDLLAACYVSSLQLAKENHCQTIAFSAISCGIYGFPVTIAAEIALYEVSEYLKKDDSIQKVLFVCFDEEVLTVYQAAWQSFIEKKYPTFNQNLQPDKTVEVKHPLMEQLMKEKQIAIEKKKQEKDRFFR